jgi:hypothetical protein
VIRAVPAAVALLVCNAGSTSAAELKLVNEFGSSGSGPGQLTNATDLEVAPNGNLVVSDTGNRRIQVFTPGGKFVRAFGSQGSGPGQFSNPTGVAIRGDGTIFVVDSGGGRVEVFSEAGAFVREFQVPNLFYADAAFNPAGTRLYLVNSQAGSIQRVSAVGAEQGAVGTLGTGDGQFRQPQGIDVGPRGNLFLADRDNNRIQRIRPNGAFLGKRGGLGSAPGQMRSPLDLAIGPDSVFVADTGNGRVQEFSRPGNLIAVYDRIAGSPTPTFDPSAITVAPSGDIFVLDSKPVRILRLRVQPDSPSLGEDVNVAELQGTVLVDVPGGGGFAPLEQARQIPLGSRIDTRRGTVSLKSASDNQGRTQTGRFNEGIFKVQQGRRSGGVTDLRLAGGDFGGCRKGSRKIIRKLRARGPTKAQQQGKKKKKKKKFRTRGRYSASTVRGTDWRTTDRCDGTVTRVFKGTVEVRDRVRDRTVVLHAGQSYLAKAPGA